jgi:DNA repair protein RadA/Sms
MNLSSPHVHILTENSLDAVRETVLNHNYRILFIDSIQTMMLDELQSAPGSVSQIREGAAYLLRLAKENEVTVFLAGHVTKDGGLPGPGVGAYGGHRAVFRG